MKRRIVFFFVLCFFLFTLTFGLCYYFNQQFAVYGKSETIDNWVLTGVNAGTDKLILSKSDEAVTVGMYNSGFLYQEDADKGIDKDIIDELSRRMGISFAQQVMPRARIHSMLEEGSLPMTVSLIETPKRAEYAFFIPYFTQKNHALIRESLQINTGDELLERTDVKVGIIRSYYYGQYYNKLISELREKRMIVEAKDTQKLYEMLKEGWIDVTFNIASSYLYYFDSLKIKDVKVMDWAHEEEPPERCLSLSKRFFTENDAKLFQAEIEEMKKDGTLHRIYSEYLPEDEAKRMCDF